MVDEADITYSRHRFLHSDLIHIILGKLDTVNRYKQALFSHKEFVKFPKDVRMLLLWKKHENKSNKRNRFTMESIYQGYLTDNDLNKKLHPNLFWIARNARTKSASFEDDDELGISGFLDITLALNSHRLMKSLVLIHLNSSFHEVKMTYEMARVYVESISKRSSLHGVWMRNRCSPNLMDYPDLAQRYIDIVKNSTKPVRHIRSVNSIYMLNNAYAHISATELWQKNVIFSARGFDYMVKKLDAGRVADENDWQNSL